MRVDPTLAEPDYVFWFLQHLYDRGHMWQHQVEHTGVARFQFTRFAATTEIPLPQRDKQRAIASILGTLDDKIELNHKMNRTLEAMAQAFFKSWFVDFDPVVAKAQGRTPQSIDADTIALFPSAFIETKAGSIPAGWAVSDVYKTADVIYGAPFSSKLFSPEKIGYPLLRIRDLVDQAPTVFTNEIHPNGKVVSAGDIVVGMDGEFRAHIWTGPNALLNQRVCMFVPKSPFSTAFVLYSIRGPLAEFERSKVGTTVNHLGKAVIDSFRIVEPHVPILNRYAALADPLLKRSLSHYQECTALRRLRDSLLPQLLSGQIRVRDAEKAVEKVL